MRFQRKVKDLHPAELPGEVYLGTFDKHRTIRVGKKWTKPGTLDTYVFTQVQRDSGYNFKVAVWGRKVS